MNKSTCFCDHYPFLKRKTIQIKDGDGNVLAWQMSICPVCWRRLDRAREPVPPMTSVPEKKKPRPRDWEAAMLADELNKNIT